MKVFRLSVLSLVLTVSGGILALAAQNRTVSGKVLDAQQQPIVGVAVLVDGTTRGTTTSENGSFTLDIPAGEVVLNATYLGYIPQKVTVPSSKSEVTIYLQEDAIQLEEAVVIGYGTQKRVNLTGAVSTVSSKELENRVTHSVTNMLQGSVAGLNITTSSGKPGSTPSINIRGVNSVNSADPLVLIDGVVGDLNRVNPNDVESISVIKDASAAAVYGARAAFGVILVTTKSGSAKDGKATVRYSGRFGWEEATTSTDYENRGYWSVYEVNRFWQVEQGTKYISYTDHDMQQLLARVNDKTEHPDRPWVVEDVRNGRKQWVYYGNYDWWDMLFREKRPVQQHSVSLSGGTKDIKYLVSGAYDRQAGMQRAFPDIYNKYNLRSKIDFRINKWATLSNNTSFFSSNYNSQGDSGIDNTLRYGSVHALACYPMQNPDGSWLYSSPYQTYKIANGRHIMLNEGTHRNVDRRSDFSNTTRLVITPFKTLSITGDFTYRLYQERNTSRSSPLSYREYPDGPMLEYNTGAGLNRLDEEVKTRNYYSTNVFANYDETFGGAHHLSGTFGMNYETWASKNISVGAEQLLSVDLDDLNLATKVGSENAYGGGQNEYALLGFFGRINYDYKGTLPRRSERPLRRNVAFRLKQPLGLVSLGIGGLAYLGGTLLRPCEERGRQPQTARLVRFAGQPERSVLLPQPAAGHAPRFRQLHLRRRQRGQIHLAGSAGRFRPDVGDRPAVGPGSRRIDAGQPVQPDSRHLYARHEGHADRRHRTARRLRRLPSRHECSRPAHQGIRAHRQLARPVPAGRQTVRVQRRIQHQRLQERHHQIRQSQQIVR